MSITPHNAALVMIWLSIAFVVIMPVFLVVMHLLMPKKVMRIYFRAPHFSPTEQAMYSVFPFVFMRVTGMAWLIAFPRFGRKRNMTDIQAHCPTWYVRLSQTFIFWIFVHGGTWLLLMVGLAIYTWLTI